jgi:signal transduction histidine kinase
MSSTLHDLLAQRRDEVLGMFVSRVMGDEIAAAPTGTRRSELVDHLPAFLDELIDALVATGGEPADGTRAPSELPLAGRIKAGEHGVTRLRQGFDIEALVREYGILRECILSIIEREKVAVSARDFSLLSKCLDAGALEAVKQYVSHKQDSLERAAAAREEVLAVVSHDLRNPLNTIVIGVHRLASLVPNESQQYKLTQTIQRAADRMLRMIGDLLDASSILAGHLKIEREPIEVAEVLADVAESFEGSCKESGLTLEVSAEPLLVSADKERLHQVLGNLVGNAIKFTPSGGTVSVSVTSTADAATFEVRDTGPGIAKAMQAVIFDRFWRGERASTPSAGLGLYIARGIVEAHGGSLSLESEEGRGTTFRFTIPRA